MPCATSGPSRGRSSVGLSQYLSRNIPGGSNYGACHYGDIGLTEHVCMDLFGTEFHADLTRDFLQNWVPWWGPYMRDPIWSDSRLGVTDYWKRPCLEPLGSAEKFRNVPASAAKGHAAPGCRATRRRYCQNPVFTN